MGHSIANEEQVLKAVEAGAQRCTHLFNGMPELHQRRAALTAVALTDDRITIEMILDGFHLHPRMVDLACRAKPKENLIGVSDSIQAAGLKDGTYHIGTEEISVKNGISTTPEGVIAGTTLTLEEGWHHLVTYSHLTLSEAAACFTINPARNVGLDKVGELRPGKQADIAFFDTETNRARLTVSRGRVVFDSEVKKIRIQTGTERLTGHAGIPTSRFRERTENSNRSGTTGWHVRRQTRSGNRHCPNPSGSRPPESISGKVPAANGSGAINRQLPGTPQSAASILK